MNECVCATQFGQLVYNPLCEVHERCPETMRGIPIQCILVTDHKGDHK